MRANAAASNLLGAPLWRELVAGSRIEWEALHPPVGDDRAALQQPLLALTKALCDQLDQRLLSRSLDESAPTNAGSLVKLKLYLTQIGADPDCLSPFFQLQDARSKGGFAHSAGDGADSVINALAPGLTSPADIFTELSRLLVDSLNNLAGAFDATDR